MTKDELIVLASVNATNGVQDTLAMRDAISTLHGRNLVGPNIHNTDIHNDLLFRISSYQYNFVPECKSIIEVILTPRGRALVKYLLDTPDPSTTFVVIR